MLVSFAALTDVYKNVLIAIFIFFQKIGVTCGGCGPPRGDVVGVLQCIFLAFGPKSCPEPNFLLVSMVTLADVHANVLGAIFSTFSQKLAKLAERAVLRPVVSQACRSAIF